MPENTPFDLEDALSNASIVPDAAFEQRLGARLDALRKSLPTQATIATNGRLRGTNRLMSTSLPQERRRPVKQYGLVPAFASLFAICLLVGLGVAILLPALNTVTPVTTGTPTQPTVVLPPIIIPGTGTAPAPQTPAPVSSGTVPPVVSPFGATATPVFRSGPIIPLGTTVSPTSGTLPPTQLAPIGASPTPLAAGPEIFDFQVSPENFTTGDEVLVTWRASGTSARLCYGSNLWYPPVCLIMPLVGSHTFTVNDQEGKIEISLMVWTEVPDVEEYPQTTKSATVDLGCLREWVLPVPAEWADHCPAAAETASGAAAQPFQNGWMIYMNQRFLVLLNAPFGLGTESGSMQYQSFIDPLQVGTEDTSAEYTPPAGLYAPTSGFGLIWRGDVPESPGFVDALGWATQPEFNFNPTTQCAVIGVRGNSRCFMTHPQRGLIALVNSGFTFVYWLDYP
jgi:hypothetical protein